MTTEKEQGYEWHMGPVAHEPDAEGTTKVALRDVPHIFVTDVKIFDEHFPGTILGSLNGTSLKVLSQAVARRMVLKDRKVTDEQIKSAILNAVRGIRQRGPGAIVREKVYEFQGVEYATLAESQAAQMAFLIDLGVDPELARSKVLSA